MTVLTDKYPTHRARPLTGLWMAQINGIASATTVASAEACKANVAAGAQELCDEDARLTAPGDDRVAEFAHLRIEQERRHIEQGLSRVRPYTRLRGDRGVAARILMDAGALLTTALDTSYKLTRAGKASAEYDPLNLTLPPLLEPEPAEEGPKIVGTDLDLDGI